MVRSESDKLYPVRVEGRSLKVLEEHVYRCVECSKKKADRLETAHGEEVGHHGGEAGREAALCDEAELQLR